ncbi:helix-turn-helix transcriptional regulator [Streptomyces lydicus]
MAVKRHELVRRRRALGFTQESLAEALGVERSTARRWESGDSSPLPFQRPRVARLLQVGAEELEDLLTVTPATTSSRSERVGYALRHPSGVDLIVAAELRSGESARAYYAQGLEVARHLRDRGTEGHALLRTCYVALYGANDHRQGLEIALQAAQITRKTSHALAGLALLHTAEAHAFLGEDTECERALFGAEKHLERSDGTDAAHELFTPTHFGRLAGSCYLSLGKFDKAQQFLQDTASRMQGRRKSRTIVLGNLTLTAIRRGDLDAALAVFNDAVDELQGTRGGGGMNIVFRAARELRPWRAEIAVQEAHDRLLALMEAA